MKRCVSSLGLFGLLLVGAPIQAQDKKPLRAGIIGLDTSHVTAFTSLLNNPKNKDLGVIVTVGYPGGSKDIKDSIGRVEGFTNALRDKYGVEIVNSVEELVDKVDVVLLESVDGRPHLQQVIPVLKGKKKVFIDKPIAGSLADALMIFELAKKHGVPLFSSSSLRFSPGVRNMKNDEKVGDVLGCLVHSPCSLNEHHPDLFWYGVHGVEALYTIMGPGCESVVRTHTKDADIVTGTWKDGRTATYRGIRKGSAPYGGVVFGSKGVAPIGGYAGYEPLVREIASFFHTGQVPVSAEETIEMFAFMEAADESKRQDGRPVTLASVLEKARAENAKRKVE